MTRLVDVNHAERIAKDLRACAPEDKADIEGRGYPVACVDSVRPVAAHA